MEMLLKDDIIKKIKPIKLVLFDVDGVMTDGSVNYLDSGEEIKTFNVRDGHGVKLLMRAGIDVGLLTAREAKATVHRAANLGITKVFQGMKEKLPAFERIIADSNLAANEVAYMGDDIIDIPVLKRAGFSAAVSDAVSEVLSIVDYVTAKPGGKGAVRELTEVILKAQGKWDEIMKKYLL